jgi:hypothetical protein
VVGKEKREQDLRACLLNGFCQAKALVRSRLCPLGVARGSGPVVGFVCLVKGANKKEPQMVATAGGLAEIAAGVLGTAAT